MNPATPNALARELEDILMTGDERLAREFLARRFNDFPPELKGDVATYLFEEALDAYIAQESGKRAYAEAALAFMDKLGKLKSALEDLRKADALRGSLGMGA